MKTHYAKRIRFGIRASRLFWKEFYGAEGMTPERYRKWLAVLTGGGLAKKAAIRVDDKYRKRYRKPCELDYNLEEL